MTVNAIPMLNPMPAAVAKRDGRERQKPNATIAMASAVEPAVTRRVRFDR